MLLILREPQANHCGFSFAINALEKTGIYAKINIDIVNVSNIFDWLEEQKNIYGNEFIITNLS